MKFIYVFCVFLFVSSSLHAEEQPMTFKQASNGGNYSEANWIAAQGRITPSTLDDFEKFLAKEEIYYYQIVFHSSGGDMEAALRLGMRIRQLNMKVGIGRTVPLDVEFISKWGVGWLGDGQDVTEEDLRPEWEGIARDGQCLSACLWAFLGGEERLADGNQLGIQQGMISDQFNRDLLGYTTALGIETALIEHLMQYQGEDVYFFNDDELDKYKIRWIPGEFMPWQIEADKNGVVAYSKTRDEKTIATLFCDGESAKFQIDIKDYIDIDSYFKLHQEYNELPDDTAETYVKRTFKEVHNGTDSIEIFGVKFPQDSFQLFWEEGISTLSIDIKDRKALSFHFDNLKLNASTSGVNVSFFEGFAQEKYGALDDGMGGLNSEGLQRSADIAFKNCPEGWIK